MKQLQPLIIIAVLANLLTLVLYNYAASQPGGTGLALAFIVLWMPAIWLTTIVIATLIAIRKGKLLFQKPVLRWTALTLLFTTPIPAIAFYYLANPTPEIRRDGMMTNTINGKIYKTEFWENTSTHKKVVYKRFIADSAQEAMYGDNAYKKDSSWIYFDGNGDTVRLEYYTDNSLISTKQFHPK